MIQIIGQSAQLATWQAVADTPEGCIEAFTSWGNEKDPHETQGRVIISSLRGGIATG